MDKKVTTDLKREISLEVRKQLSFDFLSKVIQETLIIQDVDLKFLEAYFEACESPKEVVCLLIHAIEIATSYELFKLYKCNNLSEFYNTINVDVVKKFYIVKNKNINKVITNFNYIFHKLGLLDNTRLEFFKSILNYFTIFDRRGFLAKEKTLHEYINRKMITYSNPNHFKGAKIKQISNKCKYGIMDVCLEFNGEQYLIELKRSTITRKDIYQISDYYMQGDENNVPVIIGGNISDDTLKLAKDLGINVYIYKIIEEVPLWIKFLPLCEKLEVVDEYLGDNLSEFIHGFYDKEFLIYDEEGLYWQENEVRMDKLNLSILQAIQENIDKSFYTNKYSIK